MSSKKKQRDELPAVTYRPGFCELSELEVDRSSLRLLPRSFCRRVGVMVAQKVDRGGQGPVLVGMANSADRAGALEAARLLGRPVEVVQLTRYEIDRALAMADEGLAGLDEEAVGRVLQAPGPEVDARSSPVDLVDRLILDAVAAGASDIHLESYPNDVDVRFRVDGLLHQVFTQVTPENLEEVVARLMVMARLDIAKRQTPQDGRIRVTLADEGDAASRVIDLRVHVTPSLARQDVVIRVLETSRALLPLRALGMAEGPLATWRQLLKNPGGLLLVTGPTGSGKTTTLYASLAELVEDSRKIITAEDPVEYLLDHVNQKQASHFLPFAELLRASLRQNPDVLLFGELRDAESAETAATAAGTGHLVLSTLHTGDAIGVVARLRNLGVADIDIAESLLGVLAQRLVRRICPRCAEKAAPTDDQRRIFGAGALDGHDFHRGQGCPSCRHTGYKGRVGIYELLVCDLAMSEAIAAGAPGSRLRELARAGGQPSLLAAALEKARAGLTTLEEIERVVPYRQLAEGRS